MKYINIDALGVVSEYGSAELALAMSARLPVAWKVIAMEVPALASAGPGS